LCVHPGPASIKTQMNKNKTKFYILLQHAETVKFFYAETMKFLHAETVVVTTKFYMLLQQEQRKNFSCCYSEIFHADTVNFIC
jgi:hypothetical protein